MPVHLGIPHIKIQIIYICVKYKKVIALLGEKDSGLSPCVSLLSVPLGFSKIFKVGQMVSHMPGSE